MPSSLESIAPDALFITFPVTDGDSSRRPDNVTPPSLSAREVNWHRTMTMEEKYACRWRNLIGQGIAKLLDKPDKEKYSLQSFPPGYWMFDHNKGPTSAIRHDLYLYGSQTVLRFRSPAEFIPHGLWLLTDPTLDKTNCGCKYCGGGGKKSQTEISEALGLSTKRGLTSVTGGGSTRIRTGAHRIPRPTKSCGIDALPSDTPWIPLELRQERKPDPTWQTLSLKLKLAASITRISDLNLDRRFRIGELVWCAWGEESHCRSAGKEVDQTPPFWPAIVLDHSFKSVVHPSSSARCSYSVLHNRRYSLLRLGSTSEEMRMQFECIVDEDAILPWQAHQMELDAWPSMLAVRNQSDGHLNPFILALRIARRLVDFWAVCNRLPIKVPSLSRDSQKTKENDVGSQVPQRSLTPNRDSDLVRSMQILTDPYPADSPPQRSPVRLKLPTPMKRCTTLNDVSVEQISTSASTSTLSPLEPSQPSQPFRVPQPKGTSIIETRYEGLWYGAERIWMGDVVRLCPERDAFAASLKLSHMTQGDGVFSQKTTAPSPGAAMRGVIMRVDRIFARVGKTGAKECVVAGPIYELAPKAWMDEVPTDISSLHTSRSPSSALHSDPVYYPWDMPHTPPRRLGRDNMVNHGDNPTRLLYPLSHAPPGYTLRPLLPAESEIILPVSLIAGRYYPNILDWSLCVPVLPVVPRDTPSLSLAAAAETFGVPLLSLCGLAPGRFNHAICVDIRLASRTRMIEEAACLARNERSQCYGH